MPGTESNLAEYWADYEYAADMIMEVLRKARSEGDDVVADYG